ncbi:MAG: hypothetical protein ACREBU_18900, partial [Nitrososphaera sp.]
MTINKPAILSFSALGVLALFLSSCTQQSPPHQKNSEESNMTTPEESNLTPAQQAMSRLSRSHAPSGT